MIHFIKHKIQNKKWLNGCLLIGVALLSAFLCIYPMFREGSLNRLLQTLFTEYIEENNEFPTTMERSDKIATKEFGTVDDVVNVMDDYEKSWVQYLNLPVLQRQQVLSILGGNAETTFGNKTRQITIGYIPGLYEHVDILKGVNEEEAKESDNAMVQEAIKSGAFPCVVARSMMEQYELVVGETLSFKFRTYSDNKPISFIITGIIEENSNTDLFWENRLHSYSKMIYVSKESLDTIIKDYEIDNIFYDMNVMYDYTKINSQNVKAVTHYMRQFHSLDEMLTDNFTDTLATYEAQEKSITTILFTFELPIVSMLLLFLYMISGQILEMETTEISMLKSRGISRKKIIKLYILQSAIISTFGVLLGLPLGYAFCKCGASTNGFLSFQLKNVSIYKVTWQMLPFAMIAFLLAVLFMTIPVIKLSTLTITQRKSRRIVSKEKVFWEKYFLDVLLILVSGYLLYNYYKQSTTISNQIISGKSVDPVIFLNSSLFILACSLVVLRLTNYLVRLIYRIGKKKWKPASYVAFLQITRNVKKQGFISIFLVMTIAIGFFNANLARTINSNMEQRIKFKVGTDLVVRESWKFNYRFVGNEYLWNYTEPDFSKFDTLSSLGVEKKAKVIMDDNVNFEIVGKGQAEKGVTLMAIHTKEFGETARLKAGMNKEHWFHALNALAKQPSGVLISSNLASKYNLSVGSNIVYQRYSPVETDKVQGSTNAKVCGIIDNFPGFENTAYTTNDDGKVEEHEKYLIVADYATVVNNFTITPYYVWMRLSPNADSSQIINAIEEKDIQLEFKESCQELIQLQKDTAMLQITNGMFSVGFIISLLICGVGFLIYWILTIRERELIYGIYRAMGMNMKEIVTMLIIEQIFGSLLAALSGFFVGLTTTVLFTRLIALVYLPKKHNMPISVFIEPADTIKMIVIVSLVFIICFFIIRKIVKNMNIAKGLKMGED